jgi:hypothetical protein
VRVSADDDYRGSSSVRAGQGACIEDDEGIYMGRANLDQDRGDLPLPIFCFEIVKTTFSGQQPSAQYLILHDEDKSGSFLRLGVGHSTISKRKPQAENYLFSGIDRTEINIF